ncbi:immunoglobulin domain-containing family protein [Salinifilum aidingensis]
MKPSETLSLSCTVSGDSMSTSHFYWGWVRQSPGRGLEWLGSIYQNGDTSANLSLKSRVAISVDPSKSLFSLHLTSVTAADTSLYYCARHVANNRAWRPMYFDVWGRGLLVTVASASTKGPSVTSGQAGQEVGGQAVLGRQT